MKEINLDDAFVGGSKKRNPNIGWLDSNKATNLKPKPKPKTTAKPKAKITAKKGGVMPHKRVPYNVPVSPETLQAVNRLNQARKKNDQISDVLNTAMAVPLVYKVGKKFVNYVTKNPAKGDGYAEAAYQQDVADGMQSEQFGNAVSDTRIMAPVRSSLVPSRVPTSKPTTSNSAADDAGDADAAADAETGAEDIGEDVLDVLALGKKATKKQLLSLLKKMANKKAGKGKATKPKATKPKPKPKAKATKKVDSELERILVKAIKAKKPKN